MIDVHCHLVDAKYQGLTAGEIIDEARRAGVEMIVNGTGLMESKKSLDAAEKNNGVWVCAGVAYEPGYKNPERTKNELRQLCNHPKVVGVGEAGLNFYSGMSTELKQYQLELFRIHLELAVEYSLPIQIHNREADDEINRMVEKYPVKTLLHCFSGSVEFMKQMAEIGCYFSFGGMITYKKNERLREVVKLVPEERLLIETDAPYLPPEPLRGTINTPVNVKIVAERIAQIRGITLDELERITSDNARRLFRLI